MTTTKTTTTPPPSPTTTTTDTPTSSRTMTIVNHCMEGRFKTGEACRTTSAVLRSILSTCDLFLGQACHVRKKSLLDLPDNFKLLGASEAFIAYDADRFIAEEHVWSPQGGVVMEGEAWHCVVRLRCREDPAVEFFVVSWYVLEPSPHYADPRRGALFFRQLTQLTQLLGRELPVLVGGNFQLSCDEANFLLRRDRHHHPTTATSDTLRCYSTQTKSTRRRMRSCGLFMLHQGLLSHPSTPSIETFLDGGGPVFPRSIRGNVVMAGARDDVWRNPEDSFYWDPSCVRLRLDAVVEVAREIGEGRRSDLVPGVNGGGADSDNNNHNENGGEDDNNGNNGDNTNNDGGGNNNNNNNSSNKNKSIIIDDDDVTNNNINNKWNDDNDAEDEDDNLSNSNNTYTNNHGNNYNNYNNHNNNHNNNDNNNHNNYNNYSDNNITTPSISDDQSNNNNNINNNNNNEILNNNTSEYEFEDSDVNNYGHLKRNKMAAEPETEEDNNFDLEQAYGRYLRIVKENKSDNSSPKNSLKQIEKLKELRGFVDSIEQKHDEEYLKAEMDGMKAEMDGMKVRMDGWKEEGEDGMKEGEDGWKEEEDGMGKSLSTVCDYDENSMVESIPDCGGVQDRHGGDGGDDDDGGYNNEYSDYSHDDDSAKVE